MMSTSTIISERERARHIIAEVIRQAGGIVTSKTDLVCLFWRAHLVYAESHPDYLSFWPVLKTADGPAIQEADVLLGELVAAGILRIDELRTNGVTGLRLAVTDRGPAAETLPHDAVEAIRQAVARSNEPPDLADYASLRCWNEAVDGEELNIYVDVIPEAEYAERKQRIKEMASVLTDLWR